MTTLPCGCQFDNLVPRIRRTDGSYYYPDVDADGVFTIDLESLNDETDFEGVGGDGIVITPGGPDGHQPTFSMCVDPNSPIPLEFIDVNGVSCLTANALDSDDPYWGPTAPVQYNGIQVFPGGVNGHTPTFSLALTASEPFGIGPGGHLIYTGEVIDDVCESIGRCSIDSLADVNSPDPDNGHILMYDAPTQQYFNWYLPEAMAAVLGVFGQVIPPAPSTGPPVELRFDPATGTFGWQPACPCV